MFYLEDYYGPKAIKGSLRKSNRKGSAWSKVSYEDVHIMAAPVFYYTKSPVAAVAIGARIQDESPHEGKTAPSAEEDRGEDLGEAVLHGGRTKEKAYV